METIKKKSIVCGLFLGLLSIPLCINAQTAGNLSFSCATTAPSGTWGNLHVLAIWIENAQTSAFIKTKAKYGYEDDHLTSWEPKSGGNTVDAITGATLSTYDTRSSIWDGTAVNSLVVPDGDYNVFIEMGWGSNKTTQHSVMSFTFTKNASPSHLTPTGNANYSNVVVDWAPTATLIDNTDGDNKPLLYPNPTNGIIHLDFKQSLESATIEVENNLGVKIYEQVLATGFTGVLKIDISSQPSGLYLLRLKSSENQYVYKVLVK